jgi:hypothetical protein
MSYWDWLPAEIHAKVIEYKSHMEWLECLQMVHVEFEFTAFFLRQELNALCGHPYTKGVPRFVTADNTKITLSNESMGRRRRRRCWSLVYKD